MNFWTKTSNRYLMVGTRMDKKPFDDVRVRKAMAMALDRQAILDSVYGGEGVIFNFPYSKGHGEALFTPLEKLPKTTAEQFEYNPERAKQLLAEAGYPNGFKSTLNSFSQEPHGSLSEMVVAYWNNIGIDVSIELHESTTFESMLKEKTHAPIVINAKGGHIDPFHILSLVYMENDQFTNSSMFREHPEYAEFRKQFDQAYASTDMDEVLELMKDLSQKVLGTVAYTQLPTPYVYHAAQPWVENYYGSQILFFSHAAAHTWINSDLK